LHPQLTPSSDGKDAQTQTQQILAVASIVPDQATREPGVPVLSHPRDPRAQEAEGPTPSTPTSTSLLPAHRPGVIAIPHRPTVSSPLSPTRTQAVCAPIDLQEAQTGDGGRQQRDLEATLASTSTRRQDGPLLDFGDMSSAVPAGEPTAGEPTAQRQTSSTHTADTDRSSLDEFVDAEG
jgi:hypothetical protein